jgi:hypothetical protein
LHLKIAMGGAGESRKPGAEAWKCAVGISLGSHQEHDLLGGHVSSSSFFLAWAALLPVAHAGWPRKGLKELE